MVKAPQKYRPVERHEDSRRAYLPPGRSLLSHQTLPEDMTGLMLGVADIVAEIGPPLGLSLVD